MLPFAQPVSRKTPKNSYAPCVVFAEKQKEQAPGIIHWERRRCSAHHLLTLHSLAEVKLVCENGLDEICNMNQPLSPM